MLMSGCEGVKALKKSLSNYSVTIGLECGSTLSKIELIFMLFLLDLYNVTECLRTSVYQC